MHALSKNVPAREIMAELFGKKTGICRGQGGSMHMFSKEHGLLGGFAFIGEGIPIGLGAAFAIKYRREVLGDETADAVSVNFFGDGTCNVGQFYECLNMASLYKLPCIFVVGGWERREGVERWRRKESYNRPSLLPPLSGREQQVGHRHAARARDGPLCGRRRTRWRRKPWPAPGAAMAPP